MATLGSCKACGNSVSDEALSCPHCGQPRPYEKQPERGGIYTGKVVLLLDYGAVVELLPSRKKGLVHISDISLNGASNTSEPLSVGDMVTVKIVDIDGRQRIRLTILI